MKNWNFAAYVALFIMGTFFFSGCGEKWPENNETWAENTYITEGKIEIAHYHGQTMLNNELKKYEMLTAVHLTGFQQDSAVAAPARDESKLKVLRLSQFFSIPDKIRDSNYNLVISADPGNPFKMLRATFSLQSNKGNLFKLFENGSEKGRLKFFTDYPLTKLAKINWETEKDKVLLDLLPLSLRSLRFDQEKSSSFDLTVISSLMDCKLHPPTLMDVELQVTNKESITTGLGAKNAWRVRMAAEEVEWQYWFEDKAPYVLLQARSNKNDQWLLKDLKIIEN